MNTLMKNQMTRLFAMLIATVMANGAIHTATADELNMITVAAVQISADADPYLLSGDFIADQLTHEFEDEILEEIDVRLAIEFSQLVAAVN